MAKMRFRWGRFFLALVGVSGSILLIDNMRRDMTESNTSSIVVSGDFANGSGEKKSEKHTDGTVNLSNGTQTVTKFEGVQNLGFSELSIPGSKLSSGLLAIINNEHPADKTASGKKVDLLKYKNEYYTLVSESVKLNEDAAEAFNRMMADYHEETGLDDFIVYGTNDTYTGDGSYCPEYFPESATGNTVDLAVSSYGGIIAYDGCDAEGWVIENCDKYGFIVRYPEGKAAKTGHDYCPWHLRYVGEVNAAIMGAKDLCLEEYIDFLKDYSFDKAFSYTYDGVNYEIYTSEAKDDATTARVPVSGKYTISGDNIGTYIITTVKN
ncbi:MAG: D-alanyl-D-alanine carboxypeptidase family protein [Ruminococcus sp.]|nr:D-alanyl-D-alanine carboxypeptidase family protein [Ruminococcus sp.]